MDIASALLAYLETAPSDAPTDVARDPHGIGKLLQGFDDAERNAALELIAAAALDDGTLSDSERAMLDQHATGGAADAVRRALSTVEAAMPFTGDAQRRRFLADRADLIRAAPDREKLLSACASVLDAAGAANVEARCLIFASALGLSDAALARARLKG
jgi:hypothetical protein